MKKAISFFMAIIMLAAAFSIPAFAVEDSFASPGDITVFRASDYLDSYDAWASKPASGKILVEFSVCATKTMPDVGVLRITIQELRSGSWYGVETYYSDYTSGLMGHNKVVHGGSLTYTGTSGNTYRALVVPYAGDTKGSDQRTIYTNSVTV